VYLLSDDPWEAETHLRAALSELVTGVTDDGAGLN